MHRLCWRTEVEWELFESGLRISFSILNPTTLLVIFLSWTNGTVKWLEWLHSRMRKVGMIKKKKYTLWEKLFNKNICSIPTLHSIFVSSRGKKEPIRTIRKVRDKVRDEISNFLFHFLCPSSLNSFSFLTCCGRYNYEQSFSWDL